MLTNGIWEFLPVIQALLSVFWIATPASSLQPIWHMTDPGRENIQVPGCRWKPLCVSEACDVFSKQTLALEACWRKAKTEWGQKKCACSTFACASSASAALENALQMQKSLQGRWGISEYGSWSLAGDWWLLRRALTTWWPANLPYISCSQSTDPSASCLKDIPYL